MAGLHAEHLRGAVETVARRGLSHLRDGGGVHTPKTCADREERAPREASEPQISPRVLAFIEQ